MPPSALTGFAYDLDSHSGYPKPLELVTTMDEDMSISPSLPTVAGNSGAHGFPAE
jgi:hypothetical protein